MPALTTLLLGSLLVIRAPVPPDAKPDPTVRGYMGISVSTTSLNIESVESGKPASKAGLRVGDTIVRIGTFEPQNYSQVISHICSFRPGAIVEIEVQRSGDRKVFKVKLETRPIELDLNLVELQNRIIIDD